ncbi:glycerol acyltransferase [Embleya scabrispora]|uniref:Glycerol acyltransferase n=1 Tax=Embleya scabrispora TaxID=159449 RepID=A0A1T3P072_9ACTN|nr:lysophospholipid acyltransferase family protein [Embleya scabrispora]OPC82352.1 glycerol acyltransferase [Embleya scabrispora]
MGEARIIPFDGAASGARPPAPRSGRRPTRPARAVRVPEPVEGEVPVRSIEARSGRKPAKAEPAASADAVSAEAGPRRAPGSGRSLFGSLAGAVGGVVGGAAAGLLDGVAGPGWEDRAADGLAFLRRRITGEYEVDEFGFDPELNDKLMAALRVVYEQYFRIEVSGLEHIPAEGGALIVANHSGTLPVDALMTQVAVHDHHPARRNLRLLAADLVFQLPLVGSVARKSGHTLACHADAERLLGKGELVGVWPEGYKGLGKPFAERYKLQRFGRGGFVSAALRTGVPIVPCSIVGAEEIYPMVGNARTLARLLNLPYFPITPTFPLLGPLGLVPLPTRWRIEFGAPIHTDAYPDEAADDPMVVFNLTDEVRETIQHTIYRLLMQRRSVFF